MRAGYNLVLFVVVLFSGAGVAQAGIGVGVAVMSEFPVGDFERTAGFGYGGMGGVEVGGENLHLTARSGYLMHLERRDHEIRLVPVFGGLKASAGEGSVYIAGELGPVFTRSEYVGPVLLGQNKNEENLGWSIGVGSAAGALDIRFMFNAWDARHLSRSMAIGLSFGFTARTY